MTFSCIERLEGKYYAKAGAVSLNATSLNPSSSLSNPLFLSDDPTEAKIMISMTVTFLAGIIQVHIFEQVCYLFLAFQIRSQISL